MSAIELVILCGSSQLRDSTGAVGWMVRPVADAEGKNICVGVIGVSALAHHLMSADQTSLGKSV